MNKRGINQYTPSRRSWKVILASWVGALLSLALLVPAGGMIGAVFASFRPCSINNAGLTISSCGKSSVDVTDGLLLTIFLGVLLIVVSAMVHAVRMTRKTV